MNALDLSTAHPRAARAELDGITFLPRSIDKARAHLPGGTPNGYVLEGFTGRMLSMLGIETNAFTAAVAAAASDEDVAAFVRAHAVSGGADTWNTWARNREVYNGDRAEAIDENPWLAEHPEIVYGLDFLQYVEDHGLDTD
jgi:hypothetical protein